MGQMITKPDANPIVLAIANVILFQGGLGYFLMGQKKKAYITWGVIIGISVITCGIGSVVALFAWVTAYDAYLLGQKLQSGQSIGENENGLSFLNAIFKD